MTSANFSGALYPEISAKKFAPLIELVGPELKVRIGTFIASFNPNNIPSFVVTKTGHLRPSALADDRKARVIRPAYGSREELRIAAFSLSTKPRPPTERERVMWELGK